MMAVASSMTILGNMVGPVAGGLIAGHFGIIASFIATSLLMVATGLMVSRKLRDDPPGAGDEPGRLQSVEVAERSP
jgi:MFS family permease